MHTKKPWALSILLLLVFSGCKQELPGVPFFTQSGGLNGDVQLMLSIAPESEGGLMVTAQAKNVGLRSFRYQSTCGRADMEFRFSDADGHELFVTNPCEPQPMMGCPTALGIVLGPSGTAVAQHWWSGRLWDGCSGTEAPAGDYRVTVTFPFYQDIEVGQDQVEATGTFHWSP